MYVFNTLTVDKTYTLNDIKRMIPIGQFGLDGRFYGGRVSNIGETDGDVLLLIENRDGLRLIDTAAKTLDNIPVKIIREIAKKRKLRFNATTSKEDLIAIIEGRWSGEKTQNADDVGKGHESNDGQRQNGRNAQKSKAQGQG